MAHISEFRSEIVRSLLIGKMSEHNSKIVLASSYSKEYLITLGKSTLSDLKNVFKILLARENGVWKMYIDPSFPIELHKSDDLF
jgi:hypothetical protein